MGSAAPKDRKSEKVIQMSVISKMERERERESTYYYLAAMYNPTDPPTYITINMELLKLIFIFFVHIDVHALVVLVH